MSSTPKQMIFCKQCKNKILTLSDGVLCSLTNKKPTFEDDCDDFAVAPLLAEKRDRLAGDPKNNSSKSNLRAIISIIIFLLALYRLITFLSRI